MGNSFRTDAGGLPMMNGDYNLVANAVKTDMGIETTGAFTPDAGNLDPRIDHAIGRRGIPYLDWQKFPGKAWIRNQPNAGPYQGKKYAYYKTDKGTLQDNSSWTPGYTAINYTIIRFADVLLMAAEAEIEVGLTSQAMTYTNNVRQRAINSKLQKYAADGGGDAATYVISLWPAANFATKADARDAVRMERKLELSGEGHRFYDLMRWSTAAYPASTLGDGKFLLNRYIAYEKDKYPSGAYTGIVFTNNQDELLPIPQGQIDLLNVGGVKVLTQNPGYGGN